MPPEIQFQQQVPPGYKATEVGTIPQDWEVVPMGLAATVINGRAFSRPELLGRGKYRVLRVGNFFTKDSWYFTDLELPDHLYASTGDLLYAWSASFGPRLWLEEKVVYHYHIWRILPRPSTDKLFLFHYLLFDVERIALENKQGGTMLHITKGAIEVRPIPLPPLPEQQAIAEVLSDVDALLDAQAAEIEKRKHIKQALLHDLLTGTKRLPGFDTGAGYHQTEIGRLPKDWKCDELGENTVVVMGQSPLGSSYNFEQKGSILVNGPVEFTDKYPIPLQWTTRPIRFAEKSDLLICVRGSSTGRVNYCNREICIGRGVAAIRALSNVSQQFINYSVESSIQRLLIESSGSTFPSIDGLKLRELKIPFPPLPEQQAIAEVLSDADAHLDALRAERAKTQRIKQALLHELLTGKTRLLS